MKKIFKHILHKVYYYFKRLDYLYEKELIEKYFETFQSVGYGVRLNGKNHIFSDPKKIIIGNNVHIGSDAYFKSEGGLIIGDNTHISRRVTIYTVNHNYEGTALPYDNTIKYKPVLIGKNVWIGMNVSIVPGVEIGEGAIIGLGTVLNRNVEPFEIVGSPKASNLRLRNISHYTKLNNENSFGGVNGKLLDEAEIDKFYPTYHDLRLKPIVFVLGTGRSGTVSITDILNQHPKCKAFHEDIYQLIRLSTYLAQNNEDDKVYHELNTIFETKIWNAEKDQIVIHSDQRLWNFVPYLSNYFPNSKFIHLEREAKACIKSMVIRDWYQPEEYPRFSKFDWAKYRLRGDLINESLSEDEWQKMTNIDKCAWYYFYINNSISKAFENLPESRKLYLNLSELDQNLKKILDFLNLDFMNLKVMKSNKIRRQDLPKLRTVDQSQLLLNIENSIKVYSQFKL